MAQPSGQVLLATAHNTEYFWYAQGAGVFDARNNAMLTKTGSAGMAVEGGANVVLGDASTSYALGATVNLTAPYSIRWRARKTTGQTTNSMPLGNSGGTNSFIWLDDGSGKVSARVPYGGAYDNLYAATTSSTTLATYTLTVTSGKAWVLYKDGTSIASGTGSASGTPEFIITTLCGGYSGGSFRLNGSLEFVHVVPGTVLSGAEVSALDADPYSVLDMATNASASGGSGTGTGSGSGGAATGGSGGTDASAGGGTGTGTGSGSGGVATGIGGAGSFTSDAMENNTGAGLLASTSVVWSWWQGSIGSAPTSTTHGTGTTNSSGVLSVTGLPSGAGFLLIRTTDSTGVYYQPGTVT